MADGGRATVVARLSAALQARGWSFAIDRGGTFTDVVGRAPDGELHVEKLLSQSDRYDDAAVEGVRRMLRACAGPLESWTVDEVRLGTTVATNALLERTGEPTLLAITAGHADALAIGRQSRPRLFDLEIVKPAPLYAQVVEIDERVTAEGEVLRPLDRDRARAALEAAYGAGLRAVAVVLMHGYRHPAHECEVAALARAIGFAQVSTSHATSALIKLVPRGETTVVDAFLSPGLGRHVERLQGELAQVPGAGRVRLRCMQSNGGLVSATRFRGKDAVLSGPAGGVVALAALAGQAGFPRVIGFDMGGTSTDVSHYAGAFERAYETEIAGVRLQTPMLRLETIAAGGGSICRFAEGRLQVGPESAGATPGPAAYGVGGPLTVTDCNFVLGRLQPQLFPAVFGPDGTQPPDVAAAHSRINEIVAAVNEGTGSAWTAQALAEAFLAVAVEHMTRAIRRISVQRGHDPADHALVAFGGAGGQHACRVAAALGIDVVLLHPLAGVMSAYGIARAEPAEHRERTCGLPLSDASQGALQAIVDDLTRDAAGRLAGEGGGATTATAVLHVRPAGTDNAVPIAFGPLPEVRAAFDAVHRTMFGFVSDGRDLVVETVAVEVRLPLTSGDGTPVSDRPSSKRAWPPPSASRPPPPEGEETGRRERLSPPPLGEGDPEGVEGAKREPTPNGRTLQPITLHVGGASQRIDVHRRESLGVGVRVAGPALIQESTGTIVVEADWSARVDTHLNLVLERKTAKPTRSSVALAVADPRRADPLDLELYASRFTAVAEEMGEALRNTARSVNIKERLDFSCAVFDAAGAMVANAPHIPVHLGSMGDCVRVIVDARRLDGRGLRRGDVYASNDPFAGGTHLPDITVIAPVWVDGAAEAPFAFVAARGHHADVGGLTPGSMPPDSRTIDDEGVRLENLLLVDGAAEGALCEAAIRAAFLSGAHPARSVEVNLADLKAQIAACMRGAGQLRALVDAHGAATVCAYMRHVQDNAAAAVREVIRSLHDGRFAYAMDSGAEIAVEVRVDRKAGVATVDFTGTSAQLASNFNAPAAITRAAVMYVFRTLVHADIPLNDGCLRPIEIVVPEGCMLAPRFPAAVVAGNVETSQAIVDALYGALGVVAASQGTMNNLTFGDARRQYYETICGGAGAGPTFDGADAVQTHMTNSRLTDPEVLEARLPVLVDRFAIRRGSGGVGAHRGGDGVVRRLVFREPMTVSILANRRRIPPFGVAGGEAGALGITRVERAGGEVEILAPTASRDLVPGDAIVVDTPGGGGFGLAHSS